MPETGTKTTAGSNAQNVKVKVSTSIRVTALCTK